MFHILSSYHTFLFPYFVFKYYTSLFHFLSHTVPSIYFVQTRTFHINRVMLYFHTILHVPHHCLSSVPYLIFGSIACSLRLQDLRDYHLSPRLSPLLGLQALVSSKVALGWALLRANHANHFVSHRVRRLLLGPVTVRELKQHVRQHVRHCSRRRVVREHRARREKKKLSY